jgi:hypothetical protein
VQVHPGMAGQPSLNPLVLVGGVVVHHHMELAARIGAGDEPEEVQELVVPVAGVASVLAGPSCSW